MPPDAPEATPRNPAAAPARRPPPGRVGWWGWTWRLALVLAVGGLVLGWLLARFEAHLLYYPTPMRGETPEGWGMPYEDVRVATSDGEELQGWWIPQEDADAPVLLFLHGNAGNRGDRLHNLHGLWQHGFAVLIVDYRGYGGSTGTPSEQGLYRDGRAAYDWLAERVGPRPVHVFGRSLGASVAARVAAEREAASLILESPFTSAPAMAGVLFPVPGIRHIVHSRFDIRDTVRRLSLPLMVIHGRADELIPFAMGRQVYEAAASPRKVFRPVPQGHHNDTYLQAGQQYWRWLRDFVGDAK